jgi:hypothetical protein
MPVATANIHSRVEFSLATLAIMKNEIIQIVADIMFIKTAPKWLKPLLMKTPYSPFS